MPNQQEQPMPEARTVLMMAAGTGGHVFPALSVAEALSEKGYQIHWLGTPAGMENRLVEQAGFPMHRVSIRGLRGKGVAGIALAPFRIAQATWQSLKVIRSIRPGAVVGFGGYIAGPGGVAARLMGVPLLIHEQNALAGMTNRWLSRIANVSLQAFPGALSCAKVVGNPVRKSLVASGPRRVTTLADMNILVVGGSLGAVAVNNVVLETWKQWPRADQPALFHQVGARDHDNMQASYQQSGLMADDSHIRMQAFIEDMAAAYQWADLVVCRAGALTVSELAAAGKPAILVPYPHAVDDHQTVNAGYLEKAGAALICQQTDFSVAWLTDTLQQLIASPETLADMAIASQACAVLDATEQTLEQIERIYREC